jgi:hypothetical protein
MKRGMEWWTRLWVVLFQVLLAHAGFGQAFELVGMPSRTVPVSGTKMTNLVFPVALETGVKVSRDVLVQRPRGVENVIELKAVRRNFAPTNLSVFGKDGRLYSFDLRYVEDTAVLSFRVVPGDQPLLKLTGTPVDVATLDTDACVLACRRPFMHDDIRRDGLRFGLTGIFLHDGLMWLCFRVNNGTRIAFTPAFVRVYTEDRKKMKRTATQDVDLTPVYAGRLASVPGRGTLVFAQGFRPFTVARGKRLVVQLADDAAGRSMELVVKRRVLLKARRG